MYFQSNVHCIKKQTDKSSEYFAIFFSTPSLVTSQMFEVLFQKNCSKNVNQQCKKRIPFILSFSAFFYFSKKWSDIIDNNQCRHGVLLTCFEQSNLVHELGKYSGSSKVIDTCMDKASLELQAIDLLAFKLKLVLCLPKPCKRSMYFQCFGACWFVPQINHHIYNSLGTIGKQESDRYQTEAFLMKRMIERLWIMKTCLNKIRKLLWCWSCRHRCVFWSKKL